MDVSLIFLLFPFYPRTGPMLMSADRSRTLCYMVTTVSISVSFPIWAVNQDGELSYI